MIKNQYDNDGNRNLAVKDTFEHPQVAKPGDREDTDENTELVNQMAGHDMAVTEHTDYLDTLSNAAMGLDTIRNGLLKVKNNGNLNKNTALLLKVGLDSITRITKVDCTDLMVAQECFSDTDSMELATNYSVESIKSMIGNLFKKILSGIASFGNMVSDFYSRHAGWAKRMERAARALQKKAKEAGMSPKSPSVTIGGEVFRGISVNGNTESLIERVKFLNDTLNSTDDLAVSKLVGDEFEILSKLDTSSKEAIDKSVAETKIKEKLNITTVVTDLIKHANNGIIELKGDTRYHDANTVYFTPKTQWLGDKRLVFVLRHEADKLVHALAVNYVDSYPNKKYASASVKSLQTNEIVELLTATIDILVSVQKSNYGARERRKNVDSLASTAERIVKDLDAKEEAIGSTEGFKLLKTWCLGLGTTSTHMLKPSIGINTSACSTAKATYGYALACYKNLNT